MHKEYRSVSVNLIKVDENRQRKHFSSPELTSLKESIQNVGLINPITVNALDGDGTYRLTAGERRLRAVKELGWEEVDVLVINSKDELEHRCRELAENIERMALTWQEKATAIQELHQLQTELHGEAYQGTAGGHTQEDTAQILGLSRPIVTRYLALAEDMSLYPEISKEVDAKAAQKRATSFKQQAVISELAERAVKGYDAFGSDEDEAADGRSPTIAAHERRIKRVIDSYIVGDAMEGLKQLPDASFDLIELDPPYGIDFSDKRRTVDPGFVDRVRHFEEVPDEDFGVFMLMLLEECNRVIKPEGFLLLWHGIEPWHCMLWSMLSTHFKTRKAPIIWYKGSKIGRCSNPNIHLTIDYEACFYARKGDAVLSKPGAKSVYTHKPGSDKSHPTEKPIELYQELLSVFATPGSQILSPFLGSGNVILAADGIDCRCLGFDKSEEFRDRFIVRAKEHITAEAL